MINVILMMINVDFDLLKINQKSFKSKNKSNINLLLKLQEDIKKDHHLHHKHVLFYTELLLNK